MDSFLWGVAVTVLAGVGIYRNRERIREEFSKRFGQRPWQLEDEPSNGRVIFAEPEPEIEIAPPDYGNIRLVAGEETDPTEFGPDIHEFPEQKPATTRFEDFNRRLFVLRTANETKSIWPDTTDNDYPTFITGMKIADVFSEINLRLRPRYPVIYDSYGHWAAASHLLEQDPDYTDAVVSTYLAIPEERRPVVVSLASDGNKDNGVYMFKRYGFKDFSLNMYQTRFHLEACLTLVMNMMTAPRKEWLWLSVARMRQTVIKAFQENEAQRRQSEGAAYLEQQAIQGRKATEHKNRFLALWQHRIEPLAAITSANQGEEAE